MEDRKLVVTTDMPSVLVDYGMTFGFSLIMMAVMAVIFAEKVPWTATVIVFAVILLSYYSAVSSSKGVFTFMAADEYKGPRVMVRLKKNDYEVYDMKADHFVIKQSKFEKKRNTGRIHVKKTNLYLRGVTNIDEVQRFLQKYFL